MITLSCTKIKAYFLITITFFINILYVKINFISISAIFRTFIIFFGQFATIKQKAIKVF